MEGIVSNIKIGAMDAELSRSSRGGESGNHPGDRSDIIMGTLAADKLTTLSPSFRALAHGSLKPASQVQKLMEGLKVSPVPVLRSRRRPLQQRWRYRACVHPLLPRANGRSPAPLAWWNLPWISPGFWSGQRWGGRVGSRPLCSSTELISGGQTATDAYRSARRHGGANPQGGRDNPPSGRLRHYPAG